MRGTHRGRDCRRATAPDRDRRRPGGRERGRRRARPLRLRTWPGRARRHPARPPLASRGLAAQAGGALGWSFTNSVLTKVCTVGVGILLARLLGPHSFGTFAVASVALTIMSNFNDLGVSLAIVRWPGEPREIAPTVTTISVVTSAVLYGGCYIGAPAYAAAMGAPSATNVVRALSLVIVIDGFATAPIGFLQRYFRQDQRTVADQANIWLGTSVTVALALAGLGPMSLALGRIAGCLTSVILLVRFSPQPLRFGFNRREVRGLLRFGLPLAGSGVVAFAIANVDQLVVGRLLGVTALGYFVLAANLSNWPSAAFSEPIGQVAPTALARLQHDPPAMRSSFETMAALVSAVTLPVCLVEAGCAAPLIRIVYGTRWLPADQPLTWLAMLAALQIFFQLNFDYFVVLAKSGSSSPSRSCGSGPAAPDSSRGRAARHRRVAEPNGRGDHRPVTFGSNRVARGGHSWPGPGRAPRPAPLGSGRRRPGGGRAIAHGAQWEHRAVRRCPGGRAVIGLLLLRISLSWPR